MEKTIKKQERKQKLLEAALGAFGKLGYHDTQVSHIIAEAKVARGTFYLYFESKREIFDALVTEISERVQRLIHPIETGTIEGILYQILGNIERATHLLFQNPLYIKIFFSDAVGLDRDFDNRLKKFYQNVLTLIQNGLNKGQELGLIRRGDTLLLALGLLGSLKEILYQFILGTHQIPEDRVIREVYHMVIHALVKPELIPQLLEKVPEASSVLPNP